MEGSGIGVVGGLPISEPGPDLEYLEMLLHTVRVSLGGAKLKEKNAFNKPLGCSGWRETPPSPLHQHLAENGPRRKHTLLTVDANMP